MIETLNPDPTIIKQEDVKPVLPIDLDNLVVDPRVIPPKRAKGVKGKTDYISKEMRTAMFKDLATMTIMEISRKYGIDKLYPSEASQQMTLTNIFNDIKKAPELYSISTDAVEVVQSALNERNPMHKTKSSVPIAVREREELKDKVQLIAEKTAEALNMKLNKLLKDKKSLDEIPLRELAGLLGTSIDKSRLLKGESTEHVMHYSKLDTKTVTPEEAMNLILKAREAMIESSNKR
jgi:hypothetical protein